ncbi:FAD-dependent oxidoreductase [Arthrobacter sp. 2MCAF14]|uniref:FAD-dependent oxidoreductase n=1 Tax=Arthrobacter sp. 2MCAF14 TaxID=3232982 RepID=UPI003F93BDB5
MSQHYDVIVVGAGAVGTQVTVGLFAGSIALLGSESGLPYERPPLSKGYLGGEVTDDSLPLRAADYWLRSPIVLHESTTVERIDPVRHSVSTTDGREFTREKLVWAAGCRATVVPISGANLVGVFSLRTLDDARQLRSQLGPDSRLVVNGGGYIGLEVAASASQARRLGNRPGSSGSRARSGCRC